MWQVPGHHIHDEKFVKKTIRFACYSLNCIHYYLDWTTIWSGNWQQEDCFHSLSSKMNKSKHPVTNFLIKLHALRNIFDINLTEMISQPHQIRFFSTIYYKWFNCIASATSYIYLTYTYMSRGSRGHPRDIENLSSWRSFGLPCTTY